ncbi:MAG: 4-hydroxybutyryl-CoA dehydratase [Desulfatitalea sp. BRH_c12]|nr:MAG: 4-hydroxybutyryl-CoA dehydratase [Desulfatitalea sp. BRH_c12]
MMTPEHYEQSMQDLNLAVYMFGKRVSDLGSEPLLRPSRNAVAKTYEMAHRPEHQAVMTATSHLSGKQINRFTHIFQNTQDLVLKTRMGRLLGAHTGCCFQRCVGMDALNVLSIITHAIDQAKGTSYTERFNRFLAHVQENDLVCDGAMTDPKGDRSLAPHEQADPDLYLRVVEERRNGIVVRGAKAHQTGALNSHEVIVMPTATLREADREYAVSFAVPANTSGITYILGRQSCDTRRSENSPMDMGNLYFGGHEVLMVFDDVFVPWERVFMYKEFEYTGPLVEKFTAYHRQSYACKVGVGDVLIGATQTVAEYNGVAKASHVRDKIVEMNHLNESLFCATLACAYEGHAEPGGTYIVDSLLANVFKHNIAQFPYVLARIAQDIAGGLVVTLPSEADFRAPVTGPLMQKYYRGAASASTENRMRILRLIEAMTMGSLAVGYLTESLHGAGSPQAQRIMIARLVNMKEKQSFAKKLCGIQEDLPADYQP